MEGEDGWHTTSPVELKYPTCLSEGKVLVSNPALSAGSDLDGHHDALSTEGGVYIEVVPLGQPLMGYPCPLIEAPWWVGGYLDELLFPRLMETPPCLNDNERSKSEELVMDTSKSKMITMEPYVPKRKRQTYRPDPTLQHFDSLFGLDNWSRFLTLKTDKRISAAKLENVFLSKCATKEMSFRHIKDNEWLIETTTKQQSEVFQSLNEIEEFEIKVERHDTLNSIQGTVVIPHSEDDLPSKYLLLDSLKMRYSNVEDVETYSVPSKKNPENPIRIAKIKFQGQNLPSKIKILGQNRELRPFVPKPLQCTNCYKYGHTSRKCRSQHVCGFCGSSNHPTKWHCCETPRCVNCGMNHHAKSKECPFYTYNTELKLLVSRTGMGIREAKLELNVRGLKDPSRNPVFKAKVRETIPENISQLHNPQKNNQMNKENKKQEKQSSINPEITTKNSFSMLTETPMDIENEPKIHYKKQNEGNKGNKRPYENSSPPKKKLGLERNLLSQGKFSEKANEATQEMFASIEEITPSPVLPTRFRTTEKTKENKTIDQNKKAPEKELHPKRGNDHGNSCGCHDCFTDELKNYPELSKEAIINVIRNFISNRRNRKVDNIESHISNCMCVEHLKFYREKKIKILDKLLKNDNDKNVKEPPEETNLCTDKKVKIVRKNNQEKEQKD